MGISGNDIVNGLRVGIGTGSDDLRSGTPLSLVVALHSGQTQSAAVPHSGFSNYSIANFDIVIIGSPRYADLAAVGLHFEGGGGIGGDNWNMNEFNIDVFSNGAYYPIIRQHMDPLIKRFTGKDKDWGIPFPPFMLEFSLERPSTVKVGKATAISSL